MEKEDCRICGGAGSTVEEGQAVDIYGLAGGWTDHLDEKKMEGDIKRG